MDGMQPNDTAGSSLISITVLSVMPVRAGKLFALASIAIDIDGVQTTSRNFGSAIRVTVGWTRKA
jgi:hypothetical protein